MSMGRFTRDAVYQACLETLEEVGRQVPKWIDQYNREAPHSAAGMPSPAEFAGAWPVTHKERSVHTLSRAVQVCSDPYLLERSAIMRRLTLGGYP